MGLAWVHLHSCNSDKLDLIQQFFFIVCVSLRSQVTFGSLKLILLVKWSLEYFVLLYVCMYVCISNQSNKGLLSGIHKKKVHLRHLSGVCKQILKERRGRIHFIRIEKEKFAQ